MEILNINSSLQVRNRIFKDSANKVSQITDAVQNIPFVQSDDAKKPVYNYDGYFEFNPNTNIVSSKKIYGNVKKGYFFSAWVRIHDITKSSFLFRYTGTLGFSWYFYPPENVFKFWYSDSAGRKSNTGVPIVNIKNNEWFHFGAQMDNTNKKMHWYFNGKCVQRWTSTTFIVDDTNELYHLYDGSLGSDYVDIKNLELHDEPFYSTDYIIGDQVFTPKQINIYSKRYKDDGYKKLFINSNYLKDAVINNNNEITTLYSEVNDVYTTTQGLILSEKGVTSNTQLICEMSNNPYGSVGLGFKDFTMSGWMYLTENSAEYSLLANVGTTYVGVRKMSNTSFLTYYEGITLSGSHRPLDGVKLNEYFHLALMKKDEYLYYFLDGVLLYKDVDSGSVGNTSNFYIQACQDYRDDILFTESLIIDPTGYSIGESVFKSPRRAGLDTLVSVYDKTVDYQPTILLGRSSSPNYFYYSSYDNDGNLSMVQKSVGSSTHMRVCGISKDKKVLIIMNYDEYVNVSQDGGLTWLSEAKPNSNTNGYVRCISLSDDGRYIMVGGYRGFLFSTDYGSTWDTYPIDADGVFVSNDGKYSYITNYSTGYIWTNDNYLDSNSFVKTSYTNKSTHSGAPGYASASGSLNGKYVYFSPAYANRIMYTKDYGITWTELGLSSTVDYSISNGGLPNSYVSNDGEKWVFISKNTSTNNVDLIHYSSDSLNTINLYTHTKPIILCVTDDFQTIYLMDENKLYKTTDFFNNIVVVNIFSELMRYTSLSISSTGKEMIIINPTYDIFLSKDYGETFNMILDTPNNSWYNAAIM